MNEASRSQVLQNVVFFSAVLLAGLCSIIYELLISTTSSYFLGDSVKQFSITIGVYMAAMGFGSFLTKFLGDRLIESFIKVELLLGLIGGLSVPLLYFVFDKLSVGEYQFIMLTLTFAIGLLTGFEIPILVRILKAYYPLKSNLAYVLGLDYIGALIATLLFPFLLMPFVGPFRTSLAFGLVNIVLGLFVYRFFTRDLGVKKNRSLPLFAILIIGLFAGMGIYSGKILDHWQDNFFTHQIVFSKRTPYQELVLTKNKKDLRLYINKIIQFSALDEYRYHECLGMLPMFSAPYKKRVLILGGGEGLLAREVLKFDEVEEVTIVDLDAEVFQLGLEQPDLVELNARALLNPKMNIVVEDAMNFLSTNEQPFDVILSDLPDPSSDALARLYSVEYFRLVQKNLSRYGVFATQASSPFHTNKAFWCIYETLKVADFDSVIPYHNYVPAFGDWGYVMAANFNLDLSATDINENTQYLDSSVLPELLHFQKDISNPGNIVPNRLDAPNLLSYFLEDWEKWRREKKL